MSLKIFSGQNASIKVKIFLCLIGFCALLLILLWLFQVVFLDSFYRRIKVSEIKHSANIVAKNIDNTDFIAIADNISKSNDVYIEVFTDDGKLVYSSPFSRNNILFRMPLLEKAAIYRETEGNNGELFMYLSEGRVRESQYYTGPATRVTVAPSAMPVMNVLIYSQIVHDKDGNENMVLLNSVVSPVTATVNTLRRQLWFITVFMLLFSVLLALLIARAVSKPIVALNRSAKILATGSYDTTFSGNGYKEIKELSDSLNVAAYELSKVDQLRKELIANISHDLRTPLTLISGYAEAMRDLPSENNAENAQVIVDETKRLSSLVNDVLDISKLQSGAQTLNLVPFNLTDSINGVIKRFAEFIKRDGYTIQFEYDGPVTVNADELRISQVVYNLLSNAINFTGEDKTVLVRQTHTPERVTIEVTDSGEGISEENLPYIWDRYFKTSDVHKRAVIGTGIGLSIVKSIVEQHGGLYGVRSGPGEGSVFWFSLFLRRK